jgi:hypothetical protein
VGPSTERRKKEMSEVQQNILGFVIGCALWIGPWIIFLG